MGFILAKRRWIWYSNYLPARVRTTVKGNIMDGIKNIFLSKTIWGALLAVIGAVLSAFNLDASFLTGAEGEIVTVLGAALAIYGRIVAVKKLK